MNTAAVKWVWSIGLLGYSVAALAAGEPPPTNPTAAEPPPALAAHVAHPQEPVGFVTGAVVGALAAGPVGALVGAGLGTWLGNRVHKAGEAAKAEARLAVLESAHAASTTSPPPGVVAALPSAEAVAPRATDDSPALDGFQGDVMFRTASAEITPEIAHQVHMLAQAVTKSATAAHALKVRIDGYADPRGSDELNMKLSQDRAEAVLGLLLAAGVPAQVVEIHAYGKTQSVAQDDDGYAMERRVRLTLQAGGSGVFTVGQNE